MNKRKLLSLILTLIMLVTLVEPTYAATKYTKTEKKLAQTISDFQENYLIDPDSFKLRKIYKINYKLKEDYYWMYDNTWLFDELETFKWRVDYSANNYYGGRVAGTIYISSTYYLFTEDQMNMEYWEDCTNYKKHNKTKTLTKHVKTLTKKYYEAM